jgi:purine-nucleoside phosphorylase
MHESADFLRKEGVGHIDIGVILGSGLDKVYASLKEQVSIQYSQIAHMTETTAPGHSGVLRYGTIGEKRVLMFCGRFHYYEGHPMWRVVYPVRIMQAWGVRRVLVTAAAGGLNDAYRTGDLVLVTDHINLMPDNPLRGMTDSRLGERFPDMTNAYDIEWRQEILDLARETNITLRTGVYAALQGPSYETQAECELLRRAGADLVGMSVVPEIIAGVQAGIRMAAVCVISNMAWHAGTPQPTSAEQVLQQANASAEKLALLISEVCSKVN